MKKVLMASALAFLMMSGAEAATVANGNFETGFSLSPTYNLNSGFMINNPLGSVNGYGYQNTTDGNVAGFIYSNYGILGSNTGAISFALADLTIGQAYSVSFLVAATSLFGVSANTLTVSYNGTSIGSFAAASTDWASNTTGVFNATGTTGTLTFTGQTVSSPIVTRGAGIDAVTINPAGGVAAVPEPASWAMMIGGFGMVGGALRRRRAAMSLA